jgi:phosphoribosylglycinamide formyltransferase-1
MKCVLIGSGTGSNAEAILTEWQLGNLPGVEPLAIISDKATARILTLGERFGVPALYMDPGPFKTRLTPETEALYIQKIREIGAEWVILAGFMRVIHAPFLEAFAGRIVNLHPSLLPSFKGLNAIRQAWEYGVKVTGCTVHFVTGELDGGPIIDQMAVPVEASDTLESLEKKVHHAEHQLLPKALLRLSSTHRS